MLSLDAPLLKFDFSLSNRVLLSLFMPIVKVRFHIYISPKSLKEDRRK